MASLKSVVPLGVCLSAWIITIGAQNSLLQAQNVHWVSLDFKTILTWTTEGSDLTYTVLYSWDKADWLESADCIQMLDTECDLTHNLIPYDRTYTADIQTEHEMPDYPEEELNHVYSPQFNPYKESNISAVNFTVEKVNKSTVIVSITDPLTSIHERGKQLSIREILKSDLHYKIIYYKSGSTGKREVTSDSSEVEVSQLDPGQSYCFMVAAYIPSRPKTTQHGAWSRQRCTPGSNDPLQEWSLGAWVGVIFILITVFIIIVTVTILCCKCCRQRNKTLQTSQSSAAI
ncbi:tissue factor-like [Morone saxatilis]|uniref:tissue factor-like n=1 Tax=Morone saxatilis TaxID=34816 RepID=UPI0015E1BC5D|nr:tissue factor-like [Morone saxatilis]